MWVDRLLGSLLVMFAGTFFGISLRSFYFTGSFLLVSKEHNLLTGQLILLMH